MRRASVTALAGLASLASAQYLTNGTYAVEGDYNVRYDTGSFGPAVEEYHYFFNQWRESLLPTLDFSARRSFSS